MICGACQPLFEGQLDEAARSVTLHESIQSLYESAEAGCFICSLYWKRVQRTAERLAKDPLKINGQLSCVLAAGRDSSPWQANELILQFEGDAVLPQDLWLIPYREISKFLATDESSLSRSPRYLVRDWLEMCRTQHIHCNQQSRSSRTPLTRSLVQQWLQGCRDDMAKCNQWTGSPSWLPIYDLTQKWLRTYIKDQSGNQQNWVPTRLIDLGTSNDQYVKLVDTRSTPTRGPYATLSHRWADSVVIQTTSSNLEQFLNAIPVTQLSKTFQDAFTAARSFLDVRYIWIDSLCIIQDDSQDWQAESITMQDVYSHSFCNLSAIATSSAVHGLFPPRNIDRLRPCEVKTNWAGRDPETYIPISKRFWDEQLDYAPLSRRGWVFQERWLAPRILHFSSDQLLWECCELNASEAYPNGIPNITCGASSEIHHELGAPADSQPREHLTMLKKLLEWLYLQRPKKDNEIIDVPSATKALIAQSNPLGLPPVTYGTQSSFKNRVSAPVRLQPSENYQKWQRLVEWYSSCKITKEEDKLIAFSGIAKRFYSALGSKYVAGLWHDNLPNELIWRVSRVESDSLQQRPSRYRAPSWSWASVDAQIVNKFVDHELSPVIAVTDTHIDHLSSDPFGQVTGGWIRVRGTLHPALLYSSDNYRWDLRYTLVLPQTGKQLYAMPDADPHTSEFSRRALKNPIVRGDRSPQMDELLDSFKEHGSFVFWYENPLYLLPVVSDVSHKGTFGIVLEPVASKRGTYKRWGWFEEAVPGWSGSSFKVPYGDQRRKRKLYLDHTDQELKIV